MYKRQTLTFVLVLCTAGQVSGSTGTDEKKAVSSIVQMIPAAVDMKETDGPGTVSYTHLVVSRNNITLISVVMAAPDYKVRFKDAAVMLDRKSTRLNSSHITRSRMPSSA